MTIVYFSEPLDSGKGHHSPLANLLFPVAKFYDTTRLRRKPGKREPILENMAGLVREGMKNLNEERSQNLLIFVGPFVILLKGNEISI